MYCAAMTRGERPLGTREADRRALKMPANSGEETRAFSTESVFPSFMSLITKRRGSKSRHLTLFEGRRTGVKVRPFLDAICHVGKA